MKTLSGLADKGKIWGVVAVILWVCGNPAAAAVGAASLGIASAAANLIGKRLVGGRRPPVAQVPPRRRLAENPRSGSFPSGHSASAFAFATGASLTDHRLAVVLYPLAGAVAYSRLHTGAHWLSDVVGGTLLGVAAGTAGAAVGRAVRRRVPRHPAT